MTGETFHDHLDVCKQCRENPLGLCGVGRQLLEEAVNEQPEEDVTWHPVRQTEEWRAREAELGAAIEADAARLPWYREGASSRPAPDALDRLTRIAGKLDLPQWHVEAAAAEVAVARGCPIEEALERLARELEILATVRDVTRREHWR